MTTLLPQFRTFRRRAFSLIEVLLAIFILGVGVISIAALFPAGIAQQRASVDDIFGPTVANNALSLLRTKLKPEDFGTFEQFGVTAPRYTIPGDFTWIRPGFIFADDTGTANVDETGAINIFSGGTLTASDASEFAGGYGASNPTLVGVPYNRALYGSAPRILISQTERYYPSETQNGTGDTERPQYVWDCMFRKFQGKVLVAIFVYRVTQLGGGTTLYQVPPNPTSPNVPPLPIALPFLDNTGNPINQNLSTNAPWDAGGIDAIVSTPGDNAEVGGLQAGTIYDPDDHRQAWQEPRQWILDQNNNIQRVLSVTREDTNNNGVLDDGTTVELVRGPPAIAPLNVFYVAPGGNSNDNIVTDIWYMPTSLDTDGDGQVDVTLTPVYATVKEL